MARNRLAVLMQSSSCFATSVLYNLELWGNQPQSSGLTTLLILGGAAPRCPQPVTTATPKLGLDESGSKCGGRRQKDGCSVMPIGESLTSGTPPLNRRDVDRGFSAL